MPQHFYMPVAGGAPKVGTELELNAAQSQHITQVMRMKAGATLACFDGRGTAFTGTLQAKGKRSLACLVDTVANTEAEPSSLTSVALALLKGGAMDRSIQLATELGASDITLFPAARSNIRLNADRLQKKLEHWHKIVIGACEQSGRVWLPSFAYLPSLTEVASQTGVKCLALQQHGQRLSTDHLAGEIRLLVGPEGGWQENEMQFFTHRNIPTIGLGETTLRAETVPSAALTLVNYLR